MFVTVYQLHLEYIVWVIVGVSFDDIVLNNVRYSVADNDKATALQVVEVYTIRFKGVACGVVVGLFVQANLIPLFENATIGIICCDTANICGGV